LPPIFSPSPLNKGVLGEQQKGEKKKVQDTGRERKKSGKREDEPEPRKSSRRKGGRGRHEGEGFTGRMKGRKEGEKRIQELMRKRGAQQRARDASGI